MNRILFNKNLINKIRSFLKQSRDLKYIDPNIFGTIDDTKENSGINFNDYFLDYVKDLPELDFDSVVKISREVFQKFGRENEFDRVFDRLINSHDIDKGTFNKDDDNCITKASENRILLSGTCYDVILLCHEIGHKLRYDNSINQSSLSDSFLFEAPSIILEMAANDHLRDNYNIDLNAIELRKTQVLSRNREDNKIFDIVVQLLKSNKLKLLSMYRKLSKDKDIVEYLDREGTSITDCVDEGLSDYSYDVGYLLKSFYESSADKKGLLDLILRYKDKGFDKPFSISEEVIKDTLRQKEFIK